MIPHDYITEWRAQAPWVDDSQVEQDLVISRALVELFSHPTLKDLLAYCRLDTLGMVRILEVLQERGSAA